MIESLKSEAGKHGDKAAVVPIHRLQDINQDIRDLKAKENLNHFQQFIINDLYQTDLPDAGFEIRSIIIVATPSAAAVETRFTWQGKRMPVMIPASYVDKGAAPVRVENYLKGFLEPSGYHLRHAPKLPHKLIAVRSGLGRYGRNNICFVNGMGSFLNLAPYFSDVPCEEDTWQDIRQMDLCHTCQACLQNCPTAAMMPTRFLIDNERCLTYFNEAGGEWNFPEWIDPSSHHTLYGCLRCQTACPMDAKYVKTVAEPFEFTEAETAFLMERTSFELFPDELKQKVSALGMEGYLGAIPRNLRVLFNKAV